MYIDLEVDGAWDSINENVSSVVKTTRRCRVYRGLKHALLETALSLSRLFPHRKKVFYLKNSDPTFGPTLLALASEGFEMVEMTVEDLKDPKNIVANIDHQTLFILVNADIPFTGEHVDLTVLRQSLKDKRVFLIVASHARHFFEPSTEPGDYEIGLQSIHLDLALAILGPRARHGSITAEHFSWRPSVIDEIKMAFSSRTGDPKAVQKFESSQVADFQPLFPSNFMQRSFDRAVIFWTDMDGHALIAELARQLNRSLLSPGEETHLETTSLSRWGGLKTMDWLRQQRNLTPEQVRGLVLIDHSLLTSDFLEILKRSRQAVLSRQSK